NTAVVTAYSGSMKLTASDTAQVQIVPGSFGSKSNVTAGTVTTSSKNVTIPLTNKGTTAATLKSVTLTWPSSDGKLLKVLLAGKVVFDPGAAGVAWTSSGSTITMNKGTTGDRSIGAGKTSNLVFQFQNNVLSGPYSFDITFTDGTTVHVDKAATIL